MMWGYDGGGMWIGSIGMALFWVVVIGLVVWAVGRMTRSRPDGAPEESALEIARKRFARGEITQQEFDQLKNALL